MTDLESPPLQRTVEVKIGRTEGFVSSYNLIFANGLRLKTADLTWATTGSKDAVREAFDSVLAALASTGWVIKK